MKEMRLNEKNKVQLRDKEPVDLKTLQWFANQVEKLSIIKDKKTSVMVVTHLLGTTQGFLNEIEKRSTIQHIFAIPYSIETPTLKKLQEKHSVITPNSTTELEELLEEKCFQFLEHSSDPLIIQDIGGYAHRIASSNRVKDSNLLGIVEDTSQGHWRYERCANLHVPVISIAYSRLKNLENTRIGQAVVYSLENLLRSAFHEPLSGKHVVVLGYGRIGRAAALMLRGRAAIVSVYDVSPLARAHARLDGFKVDLKANLLPEADIVLGVSGHRSFDSEDISLIKHRTVLASGSSKSVEFDVPGIIKMSRDIYGINEYVECIELLNGKSVVLLYRGQPINFIHGSSLGGILDLVFTALFECGRVLEDGTMSPGLQNIPLNLEEEIVATWEQIHGYMPGDGLLERI
ncbi:hypothetical protein BZZ01_13940 [Nostocales cyanobacterium HT-58-2]|nr:hypothetical protein BZZ01_13940 [Nostocales cyanobacterium HT-58-2]